VLAPRGESVTVRVIGASLPSVIVSVSGAPALSIGSAIVR
jgi:hypothetical protein